MKNLARTLWLTFCVFLNAASSPYLYHVDRFPTPRPVIRELLTFNRAYKIHINGYRNICPDSNTICLVEKECDLLWMAWDSLDDAKNELFSVRKRRSSLGVLLNIIGPEMFMEGRMPPHVPYWRFTEVR